MRDLTEIVATSLRLPPERVTDDLSMETVPEWDSLAHIDLMMELEREYGIEVDQDALLDLTDVRAIRAFVARHRAAAGHSDA